MSLLVLAFPVLDPKDFDWIQSLRKKNDKLSEIIAPHFTIVFAVDDITEDEFIKEIEARSKNIPKIEFEIKQNNTKRNSFI